MPGRILIADGVATNRISLKVMLCSASYDVVQATDTAQALETARSRAPDLAIVDCDLPGEGGLALCRRLKAHPETADIAVLLTCGQAGPDARLAALAAGAEELVEKGTDRQVFMARIRSLLRLGGQEREWRLRSDTAAELGFHDPAAPFTHEPRVLIAAATASQAGEWAGRIAKPAGASVQTVAPADLLDHLSHSAPPPDVVVLAIDGAQELNLLAELRSRAETRHAGIITLHDPAEPAAMAAALDLGASETVPASLQGQELAARVARQIARKARADRIRDTLHDSLKLAVTDPLTGLYNRRYALPHLARVARRAEETGKPFSVMVLDLDRFKEVNDRHGHSAGDAVLKEIARRLKDNLRTEDLVARIGGEEFLVVMPDTGLPEAHAAAERLRRVTAARPVRPPGRSDDIHVTLSVGLSVSRPNRTLSTRAREMFERADRALMGAKVGGRNQVTIARSAA
jgi:two-component system cell cycle response regulator